MLPTTDPEYQPINPTTPDVPRAAPLFSSSNGGSAALSALRSAGVFVALLLLVSSAVYYAPASGTRRLVEHPIMMPTTPFYHDRFMQRVHDKERLDAADAVAAADPAVAVAAAAPVVAADAPPALLPAKERPVHPADLHVEEHVVYVAPATQR
eukprot:GO256229.1.p2 GENE.GO256229.1~~GO256229.1.p2  ORF type:complete len:165 (+),score=54.95 GO256229.1:37-495(+)